MAFIVDDFNKTGDFMSERNYKYCLIKVNSM